MNRYKLHLPRPAIVWPVKLGVGDKIKYTTRFANLHPSNQLFKKARGTIIKDLDDMQWEVEWSAPSPWPTSITTELKKHIRHE